MKVKVHRLLDVDIVREYLCRFVVVCLLKSGAERRVSVWSCSPGISEGLVGLVEEIVGISGGISRD